MVGSYLTFGRPPHRTHTLIALLLLASLQPLTAQDRLLPVLHFQKVSGIFNEQIRCRVVRDGEGYVWVGTINGLERFDGYSVRDYRNTNATSGGGASFRGGTKAVVFNNIFWADSAAANPEIDWTGATGSMSYCDIQGGGISGEGNISANPDFDDPLFNLKPSSRCIGGDVDSLWANGTWYHSPTRDFDGTERPAPGHQQGPDMGAQEETLTVDVTESLGIPSSFALEQNHPNPFNPSTTIRLTLPVTSHVKLSVHDMLGREVCVLVNEKRDAGVHDMTFDASGLSSGVYPYRLYAGGTVQTRKMTLVR